MYNFYKQYYNDENDNEEEEEEEYDDHEIINPMKKLNLKLNLTDKANIKMKKNIENIDKRYQNISFIHKDLNFRRNSLNILIGKRDSGKTYNVIREIIKLCLLPDNEGYTTFVIISNKNNDSTINEQKDNIRLKIIETDYDNAINTLNELTEGKTAYDQVISNNLDNKITESSKKKILDVCGDNQFYNKVPCTIILFDDAINILKLNKYSSLLDVLFRNRQPRFTIFICAQDFFGIPPKIRRNVDGFWLFGGFKDKTLFKRILGEVYEEGKNTKMQDKYWGLYNQLTNRDALYIDTQNSEFKEIYE
jgi:hypothetical protein